MTACCFSYNRHRRSALWDASLCLSWFKYHAFLMSQLAKQTVWYSRFISLSTPNWIMVWLNEPTAIVRVVLVHIPGSHIRFWSAHIATTLCRSWTNQSANYVDGSTKILCSDCTNLVSEKVRYILRWRPAISRDEFSTWADNDNTSRCRSATGGL